MFIQNCYIPDVIVEPNLMSALAQIEAESMGWIPLEDGAYLHVGSGDVTEVLVVGVPQAGDAVLLVG
jgi:hypothetical protein